MKLHLAKYLSLPSDAVTRTFGILAVRGAGKSNTAAVMAEEMFAAHLPFCVIDPVGSWYGLRSSADGKSAGLAIPIFGGRHGDVPLERGAGELIADLIVEKRLTCVLDLSRFESESANLETLRALWRQPRTINAVAALSGLPVASVCSLKVCLGDALEVVDLESVNWGPSRRMTRRTRWRIW